MPDTALALLNSAQQTMSDVANRIDRSMTQQLQVQGQSNRFEVDTMMNGYQFAEQSRMADAQIQSMKDQNYLAARRFELDQELRPLQVQAERMRLEAYANSMKEQTEMKARAYAQTMFNSYDQLAGRQILHSGSADHAKEYLEFKADTEAKIKNGEKIDTNYITQKINEINGKYKDSPIPWEGRKYSPEDQMLFHSISPDVGKAYDMMNPAIKQQANSLAVTMLEMDQKDMPDFMEKTGQKIWLPEQIGALSNVRRIYQDKKRLSKELDAEYFRMNREAFDEKTPVDLRAQRAAESSKLLKEKIAAENEMAEIVKNVSIGNYMGFSKVEESKKQVDEKPKYDKPESASGITNNNTKDPTSSVISEKYKSFAAKVYGADSDKFNNDKIPETELRFLYLNWYQEHKLREQPTIEATNQIKKEIDRGIDSTGDVGIKFTKSRIDAILSDVNKAVYVPVPDLVFDKAWGVGIGSEYDKLLGLSIGKNGKIKSYDDAIKLLNSIDSKYDREIVAKELYSAILTAGTINAITDR